LEAARQAAMGAIQDPVTLFVPQRNMLGLPAIQALQKSTKEDASLFQLLTVFQQGKLQDYYDYIQTNKTLPGGLDAEKCVKYMRILSLCSLASEHEEIPYAVVASTLQIPTDDATVESWVISAVSSGLLSAKMDQLQTLVLVERCVVRRFDMEQWKQLQSRLHAWKQNVGSILQAYKQQQAAAATTSNSTAVVAGQ
jgi:translation initiation factor 3 subunit M